jgi:hypothetical protein
MGEFERGFERDVVYAVGLLRGRMGVVSFLKIKDVWRERDRIEMD